MITKAYVQSVLDNHTVRVRIPLFNKLENVNGATPNGELSIAPICTVANIINDPHIGDIVFVAFEEDDLSKPIVIGYLSLDNMGESYPQIKCDSLEAIDEVKLSTSTTIGDIKYSNISQLKNLKENVANKFSSINQELEDIEADIKQNYDEFRGELGNRGSANTNPDTVWGSVTNLNTSVSNLNVRMGTENSTPSGSTFPTNEIPHGSSVWDNLFYIKHNFLDTNSLVLKSNSFGNSLPKSPKDGQLFFMPLKDIDFSKVTLYNVDE